MTRRTSLSDSPKPERKGSTEGWNTNMDVAAQCRAVGLDWEETAEKLELSKSTVENYPSRLENFDELVEWYRNKFWTENLEEHIEKLWPEALDALYDVLTDRDKLHDENGPDYKDIVRAAKTVLNSTAYKEAQAERRKLKAQEDVTGSPGSQMTIRQEKAEDLDEDELDERIRHLREVAETGEDPTAESEESTG